MARIPYADLERVHPKVRATYEALPNKLNIFRMLAHAERNYAGFTQLGGTILARQDLAADLRELAILYIASVSKARYEWQQHVPIAKDAGLRDEQIAALEAARIDADCFDARERLVLRFTHEVVHDVLAEPWRGWLGRLLHPVTWAALCPHRWLYRLVRRLDAGDLEYFTAFHCLRILVWSYVRERAAGGASNPWSSKRARAVVAGRFARITSIELVLPHD